MKKFMFYVLMFFLIIAEYIAKKSGYGVHLSIHGVDENLLRSRPLVVDSDDGRQFKVHTSGSISIFTK